MSTASERTKHCRILYWVLWSVSLLLTIGPMLGYLIYGFATAEVHKKLVLSLTTICALVFGVISILTKKKIRSLIWLLMIGLTVALNNITVLVIIYAICSILDEFLVEPAVDRYKTMLISNKEMDKRGV